MSRGPSLFAVARRSFWLLFGGIWLLAGLFMLVFAGVFALRESEYANAGVTTNGMVLAKTIDPADSDSSTEYRISYRFTTEDERVVEGSDAVSVETWEGLVERGPIEVRYIPARPESNRLSLGGDTVLVVVMLFAGVLFGGIGGFLFFRALRSVLRSRRLLTTGQAAVGTVLGVEETNVSLNRRQQFKLRYSYTDQQGRSHEGRSGYMDWTDATEWSPGQTGAVRYDPQRPEESDWVGEVEQPSASSS